MKLTKMARLVSAIVILTALAINIYVQYKSNESYNRLRLGIKDVKNSIYELRGMVNSISRRVSPSNKFSEACTDREKYNGCGAKYTVISKNGKIGILNSEGNVVGSGLPKSTLNHNQNEILTKGIKACGESELDRIIDSFCCDEEMI